MFFRLPLLLARRVAFPAAAPRVFLARPFSYTPLAFSPAKSKAVTARPKAGTKTKAKSKTTAKAKPKASAKPKATTRGRKKAVKKANKPLIDKSQLKVPIKRPPSAYIVYVLEQGSKGPKSKNRQESVDRTIMLAAQWRALSEEQRQVYKEKSEVLAKKIKADYNTWLANVDPVVLREINKRRKVRGKTKIRTPSTGPKRPLPAFLRFLREFRVENPSLTVTESSKQGGLAWHQLPQTKKDLYLSAFQNAKKAQEARA